MSRRWPRFVRLPSRARRLVMRAATLAVLILMGYLIVGAPGAFLAAGLALIGLRLARLPLLVALVLLATAAAATVVEQPLSASPGAVARFPIDHHLAATTGRLAGIAVIVAVFALGRRDRGSVADRDRRQPSSIDVVARRRRLRVLSTRRWPTIASPLSLAIVVSAMVLRFVGDGHLAWMTPGLIAAGVTVAAFGVVAPGTQGTTEC